MVRLHSCTRHLQPLVLFTLLTLCAQAQEFSSPADPLPPIDLTIFPNRPSPPSNDPLVSTPLSSDATMSDMPTQSAPPSRPESSGDGDDGHNDGLLNYYFLLLAVFIIVICIIYWSLSRKRRLSHLQSQHRQQSALYQDLDSSPSSGDNGTGRFTGTWRRWRSNMGSRDTALGVSQEGLDERGEAPPPYVKEPGRAHLSTGGSRNSELAPWTGHERNKPPDYEERAGHERAY